MLVSAFGALLVAWAGCGEEQGAAAGATVAVYSEAPLCVGAQRELATANGGAGGLRVRLVCLPGASRGGGGVSLAAVGANARRATEDSAAVAYLETPKTPSFSRTIVEAADIPLIRDSSGGAAMGRLLEALAGADPGSLRASVREAVG